MKARGFKLRMGMALVLTGVLRQAMEVKPLSPKRADQKRSRRNPSCLNRV